MSPKPLLAALMSSVMATIVLGGPAMAQQAETVRDTDSARVILFVVVGLTALGVALTVVTVWFWRATRPDHPVLVRLEVLGGRRARHSGLDERRRMLDAARAPRDGVEPAVQTAANPDLDNEAPIDQPVP